MPQKLEIHLFGGLQIRQNGAPAGNFISSKAPALLAYAAVAQRPHQREALAGLLWGEMSDDAAANNLRQTLTNLRKVLGAHLIITRETVAFDIDQPYSLDVETFTDLLRLSKGQPRSQRIGLLQQALAVYEGEFLEGFYVRDAPDFEEWVLGQRVRLREMALQGWDILTGSLLEVGDYENAVESSARLLALDPWREETHRQRMLALARSGQFSAALAQYQTCRRILHQEFDIEPAIATTALYERIRTAMTGPRHNLPAAATGFIGRSAEIGELRILLASPETRLLTLWGPGGVGKTRLALEVATACESTFLNGVRFATFPAAQAGDSDQLALTLAQALNLPLTGSDSPRSQLFEHLRSKEMLLVLDNLDDWLDEAGWLSSLLAQAPDLKILVTSRQRLDLQAERVYLLGGLSFPAEAAEHPEAFPAVQLFVRRARRVRDDFAVDADETAAIARICRLLDGLPLGIELAAAWTGQYRCAEIAEQIERNLDFLVTTRRDVTARQRSLRAVFDWSWSRMTAEERQAFQVLAVFRGPFSRKAAENVAAATPTLLAALIDKSLVWRRGDIYQLHEVSRQYGWDKLIQVDATTPALEKHARYYASFLAENEPASAEQDQQNVLSTVDREFENVQSAWQWLVEHKDVEGIDSATDGLYHFTAIRSRFYEAYELFHAARLAMEPIHNRDHRTNLTYCRALAREGRFLSFLSRYDEAEALLRRSLDDLRTLGERSEIAFVLGHLGGTARLRGDLRLAEGLLQEGLALRRELEDIPGQAIALLELAGVAFMAAEFQTASAYCLEGLELAESASDLQTIAHLLTGLSLINRELGRYEEAMSFGRRSQAIYEALEDRYGVIQAALTLGELSRRRGDSEQARQFCQQAAEISRSIGHRSGEADAHYRLGQIAVDRGETAEAFEHFRQALDLAYDIGETRTVLDTLLEIGCLLARVGDLGRAAPILAFLQTQTELPEPQRLRAHQALAGLPDGAAMGKAPETLISAMALVG
ncbi:MAG: tetratricopeptide repeat protein [Caldilineales bacterium]|nr:tetratricopeptide repeat protein [Caldilineales bacterium]